MNTEIYLHTTQVSTGILYWIGLLLSGGKTPVHSAIYWKQDGKFWKTELTNDPPSVTNAVVVGTGDGYTIQVGNVSALQGSLIGSGDADQIAKFAALYANTEKGDLNSSFASRDWYGEPQGYGGPMYDKCTSNTYAAWILRKVGAVLPPKPVGALGWDDSPFFPGPRYESIIE